MKHSAQRPVGLGKITVGKPGARGDLHKLSLGFAKVFRHRRLELPESRERDHVEPRSRSSERGLLHDRLCRKRERCCKDARDEKATNEQEASRHRYCARGAFPVSRTQ